MSAATLAPAPPQTFTPEEFALLPDADRFELVDGRLEEREMSNFSLRVGGDIHRRVSNWSLETKAGVALPDNTSYCCFPRRPKLVRKPDVSFFTAARWKPELLEPTHIASAPDLIVEVLSPRDDLHDVARKVREFFQAGTREAWLVYPSTEQIERRHADGTARWHEVDEPLDGAPLLPGFAITLADVLAALR